MSANGRPTSSKRWTVPDQDPEATARPPTARTRQALQEGVLEIDRDSLDHSPSPWSTNRENKFTDPGICSPSNMDSDHDDLDFYDDDPSGATDLETALQDLWTIIDAYKPQTIQLESQLKCFIPDYQPAIGDIDPMIKIPEPKPLTTNIDPQLGLKVIDEPSTIQSDPTIVDLQLRAMSKASAKSSNTTGITIRSIDMRRPDASRTLAQFCKHVLDIHSTLQPDRVLYSKKMPNPETLMDLWDHPLGMNDEMAAQKNDVEKHMVQLVHKWMSPKSSMDLSNQGRVTMSALNLELKDYTRLVCILADIPVYHSGTKRNAANVQVQSRSLVESLHVLFNLYLEFKNSPHFSKYSIPE